MPFDQKVKHFLSITVFIYLRYLRPANGFFFLLLALP
jgi:hypothetical protein